MKVEDRFPNWRKPWIKHNVPTEYGWVVLYPENFILNKYTDIGFGTFINAKYDVRIEEEVEIGPYCCILSDNSINNEMGEIIIKARSKIGAYSLILPNIIIPEGTIVKARSIVYFRNCITCFQNLHSKREYL